MRAKKGLLVICCLGGKPESAPSTLSFQLNPKGLTLGPKIDSGFLSKSGVVKGPSHGIYRRAILECPCSSLYSSCTAKTGSVLL